MEVVKYAEISANFTWINIGVKLRDAQNLLQLLCPEEIFVSKWAPVSAWTLIYSGRSERFCSNCSRSARRDWTSIPDSDAWICWSFTNLHLPLMKKRTAGTQIAPRAFHFLSCHKPRCKDVLSTRTFWFWNTSYLWLMQQHVADRAGKTKGIL